MHVIFVGGAYGSKSGSKIEPLLVALAHKAQRPVRLVQNVAAVMVTCRRHAVRCRVKTGVKKDGALTAKEAEIYLDTGAYAEIGPVDRGPQTACATESQNGYHRAKTGPLSC